MFWIWNPTLRNLDFLMSRVWMVWNLIWSGCSCGPDHLTSLFDKMAYICPDFESNAQKVPCLLEQKWLSFANKNFNTNPNFKKLPNDRVFEWLTAIFLFIIENRSENAQKNMNKTTVPVRFLIIIQITGHFVRNYMGINIWCNDLHKNSIFHCRPSEETSTPTFWCPIRQRGQRC